MYNRRRLVAATFLFVTGNAIAFQARGALLVSFQEAFSVRASLLGLVASASTAGLVLTLVTVGFAAGRIDLRLALLAGAVGVGVCLLLVGVAPIYPLLLVALFGQGASAGLFRGADRPILSHLYSERLGRIFNLQELAWAGGAAVGPLLVTGVVSVTDWRVVYVLLAVPFVGVAWLLWDLDAPASTDDEERMTLAAFGELLRRPTTFALLVAMVLIGGIEGTVFTWLPYYAGEFVTRGLANAALSTFMLGYVVGRSGYSLASERVDYLDLVLVLAIAAAPVLYVAFGGFGTRSVPGLFGTIFLAGVLVSGMFPTLLAHGIDAVPKYSGPINALGFSAASVGIAVVPAAVGILAEAGNVGIGMQLTAVLATALVCTVLVMRATN